MKIYDTPEKKKWVRIIGIVASLGGSLTAANLVFGTEIRPAWAWEVKHIAQVSQAQYEELRTNQLAIHLEVLGTKREALNRELTNFRVEAEKFRRDDGEVPGFLQQSIRKIKDDIRAIEVKEKQIEQQLGGIFIDGS